MQQIVFYIYYSAIIIGLLIGIIKYKKTDNAMRMIIILLMITSISELLSYSVVALGKYDVRYAVYHFYSIVEMFLQSLFFIYAIKPYRYKKFIILSAIVWPIAGLLNMLLLQPWNDLNNNMLMIESFATITMSLFFIYWLLKNDHVRNIFKYSHFWIAICFLVLWSSSFFYWAFIRILYKDLKNYYDIVNYGQNVSNILVYTGIAAVLFFYKPLKLRTVENR